MLVNNLKSLGLYLLASIIGIIFIKFCLSLSISDNLLNIVAGIIYSILLICIGFLIKPQGNLILDFLSCILIALIGVLFWWYCYTISPVNLNFKDSNWLLYYLYVNAPSFVANLIGAELFNSGERLVLITFIPNLLIFFGIEIRRVIKKFV